jgi:hypothetical protein
MAPGEALRRADAAIVGELVDVVPRGRLQADYRYRVQGVYKQGRGIRRGSVISVRSATQSAACGLPGQTDRSYGLMLDAPSAGHPREGADGGRWSGGLCGVVAPRTLRSAARHPAGEARGSSGAGSGHGCTS